MNVGQALAKVIKGYGARHVFTLTGAPQDMLLALDHDEGIQVVLAHSERAAIAMADGYARITRQPSFTYNQFGPGVTALAGGLSDAFWAFSPVVSITSAVSTANRFRNAYQEVDHQALLAPMTKWVGYATEAARAPDMLHRAVIEAMSGVPGPVHLDVASNYITAPFVNGTVHAPSQLHRSAPCSRPEPTTHEVAAAVSALRSAKHPLILAGGGVIASAAWDELTALAQALSIPVVTSMAGKGSIAETSPLSVGVCGVYSRDVANEVMAQADVVLAIGTQLGQMPTDVYKQPRAGTRLVHVDVDARRLNRNFACELPVVADARAFLAAVIAHSDVAAGPAPHGAWAADVAERVQGWRRRFEELASEASIEGGINPRFVMRELNRFVTADDIVVADTGYSAAWAGSMIELKAAGQGYVRAAGSLGWGLPGAIGVKLAAPGRRVVCLTGDGGIGYHITDLETAVRLKAPMVVVLLNNCTLGFEYTVQKLYYGRVSQAVHGYGDIRYADIATALGAHGERVTDPLQLMPALQRASDSGRPALVEVMSSPEIGAPYTRYENVVGQRVL